MFEMLMLTGFLYAALARLLPEANQNNGGGRARRDGKKNAAEEAKPKPIARPGGGPLCKARRLC